MSEMYLAFSTWSMGLKCTKILVEFRKKRGQLEELHLDRETHLIIVNFKELVRVRACVCGPISTH